jgi:hypothetical protein
MKFRWHIVKETEVAWAWLVAVLLQLAPVIFDLGKLGSLLGYFIGCFLVMGVYFGQGRVGEFRIWDEVNLRSSEAWVQLGLVASGLLVLGAVPVGLSMFWQDSPESIVFYQVSLVMTWLAAITTVPWCAWLFRETVQACSLAMVLHLGAVFFTAWYVNSTQWLKPDWTNGPGWITTVTAALPMALPVVPSGIISILGVLGIGRMIDRTGAPVAIPAGVRRLWKELRGLSWAWTVALILPLMVSRIGNIFWVISSLAMSTVVCLAFGHEYHHQTMGLLLSQPISRRRLWYEKMSLAGGAILLLLVFTHPMSAVMANVSWNNDLSMHNSSTLLLPLVFSLAALTTGPTLLFMLRNTLAAILFTPVIHFFVITTVLAVLNAWEPDIGDSSETYTLAVLASVILSGVMYLEGCRRFARLEWIQPREQPLPDLLSVLRFMVPANAGQGRGAPWVKLLGKELQLQRVSFWLAGGLCVVCAIMAGLRELSLSARLQHPESFAFATPEFIRIPLYIYLLLAPIIIGSVCFADERSIGVWEWHLTLPPARSKQWLIKIATVYVLCLVLGFILPICVELAYRGLGLLELEATSSNLLQTVFFGLFTLGITVVAIYSSSLSQSSIKAILTTLGLATLGLFSFGATIRNFELHELGQPVRTSMQALLEVAQLTDYAVLLALAHLLLILLATIGLIHWLSWRNFQQLSPSTTGSWIDSRLMPIVLAVGIGFIAAFETAVFGI